ncbi:MAG: hypothetical protein KGL37_02795 [Acidobacteriota bacterium]|nr:hypothetical protein [Acidobacteriota bacterium]
MALAQSKPHFSIPSIIAIAAAIACIFESAGTAFILAIVAIVFGALGFLLALAPSVRGGIISIISLILAAIGIVIAVLKALV